MALRLTNLIKRPRIDRAMVLASLRTLLWVSIITLFVWIWADLERSASENITITLKIETPAGGHVRLIGPTSEQILFTVEGPQRRVSEFVQNYRRKEYTITIEPDHDDRRVTIDVLARLNQWPALRDAGLTAKSPAPTFIDANLDLWIQVPNVTVEPRFSGTARLEGQPVVNPQTVSILVPSRQRNQVGANPVILTQPIDLTGMRAGEELTQKVNLVPYVNNVPVDLGESLQVQVSFLIQQTIAPPRTIPITAEAQVPPQWLEKSMAGQYVLIRDVSEWQHDVVVQGPREEMERLNPNDIRALVELSDDDLQPAETRPPRKVSILLPPNLPNLKVISPTDWTVGLRLEKRTTPTEP